MPAPAPGIVSVCIATFRRNERLRAALGDLAAQERLPDQVVVVDNDAAGGARAVIEQVRAAGAPFRIDYEVQPERNIALTRNRTVALAAGEWIAFIDDDERIPPPWLRQLLAAAETFGADGVLSPVEPQVPPDAPEWIRRGRFYDFAHFPDGAAVPFNCMRFGNVLLRAGPLRNEPGPFDVKHGLMPGEDLDLLVRMARNGAKIVWCEAARVYEPIEKGRLRLSWMLIRAMSGGQGFARYSIDGGFGPIGPAGRCWFFLRALLQGAAAALLVPLAWPFGRHHAAAWLIKASANLGKLSVLWGWYLRPYAG